MNSTPINFRPWAALLLVCTLLVLPGGARAQSVCDADGSGGTGGSAASGSGSFACGISNGVSGTQGTAVGFSNAVIGSASTAVGNTNFTTGVWSTAVGILNNANGDYSVSLGSGSYVGPGATGSVAIGGASASVNRAQVNNSVTDAVALGSRSVADQSNTVSVGSSSFQRRIVNVAAGTSAADAINKTQLDAVQSTATAAQASATTALANLQTAVNQLLQSGLCSLSGGTVTCGNNVQLAGGTVAGGASNAIAVGAGANAQSSGGIALGMNAVAVQSNSVPSGASPASPPAPPAPTR